MGELFERHGRLVFGLCRFLLRDPPEAEDATQQTFLSAYRSLLSGNEPREPAAWLATIARNECRVRIKARMAEPFSLLSDVPTESSPDHDAGRREEIVVLTNALAALPQRQREAIVLREFYGLSHDEVALALGVSASAADALLVRARRRLQDELRPARVASGALALPLALSDNLGQAIPGFLSGAGASGMASKVASLPLLTKLAGAAATVAVVGVGGGITVHDRAPLPSSPSAAAATITPSHEGRAVRSARVLTRSRPGETAAADEQKVAREDESAEDDDRDSANRPTDIRAEGEVEAGNEASDDEGESSAEAREAGELNESDTDDEPGVSDSAGDSDGFVDSETSGKSHSSGSDDSESPGDSEGSGESDNSGESEGSSSGEGEDD